MPPVVAAIIFAIGILGLFYLERDKAPRMSKALWIPMLWLFLISSRPVSLWLGVTSPDLNAADASQVLEDGSPIDRNVFMLLLLAALVVLITRSNRVNPLLRRNVLILLYFAFCAVSVSWSAFPFVALKRWTKALGDLGMVLIILTEWDALAALKRLVTRLGFIIFPLSILFIKYYPEIGRRLTKSWTEEPIGVTTQKNELGLDCMLYGVFFLWMLLAAYRDKGDPNRRRRMLAYGTIVGMIAWLLGQCNSTTSITGLISAAAVMWFAGRPSSRKPTLVHVLVVAVLGMAISALFLDPGGGMVEALGKDPTLTGRTEIWTLVLGLHTNPLIGTGYESFWLGPRLMALRKALDGFPVNEAHNGYLEVYLNLGWAGICFIALFLMTAYKRVISNIRLSPEQASVFLGLLLCILFYSFTEAAFRLMSPAWLVLLLVIIAGSQPGLFVKKLRPTPTPSEEIAPDEELVYASHSAILVAAQ